MLKKKFALLLVLMLVFSTFNVVMADPLSDPETTEVTLPDKMVIDGEYIADVLVTTGTLTEVDDWPIDVEGGDDFEGTFPSGEDIELEPGTYTVTEQEFDGYEAVTTPSFTLVVTTSTFTYYDGDVEPENELDGVPDFENARVFGLEGFWAIPSSTTASFTEFGKAWGGYFNFAYDEAFELKTHNEIEVGTVMFDVTSPSASFEMTDEYLLVRYHIHVTTGSFAEPQVEFHDNGDENDLMSPSPGHFNDKGEFDPFVEVADGEITVPVGEELIVAVHGEVFGPLGELFTPFEEEPVDPPEDPPVGPVKDKEWKDTIAPGDRGNKFGQLKKELSPEELEDLILEFGKKGGWWKKAKLPD